MQFQLLKPLLGQAELSRIGQLQRHQLGLQAVQRSAGMNVIEHGHHIIDRNPPILLCQIATILDCIAGPQADHLAGLI